jgi:tetratricopeptide (TPR) repeat protein
VSAADDHPQALRTAADAILELHESGQLEDALAACDRLLRRTTDLDDVVVRQSAFTAWFERGALLAELGELEQAAATHLEAANGLPFDLDDPDQSHELALLLLNAGTCFDALGDAQAALAIYDRLVDALGRATDPVTFELVVRGRVNRTVALLTLDRLDDALEAAGELAAQLTAADAFQAEQLGMAVRIRAAALRTLDRPEEAATVLADTETLVTLEAAAARCQGAAAQGERAELLAQIGRVDEAIALLDATVDRLADDPEVAPVVEDLRLVEADLLEAAGQHDRATAVRSGA